MHNDCAGLGHNRLAGWLAGYTAHGRGLIPPCVQVPGPLVEMVRMVVAQRGGLLLAEYGHKESHLHIGATDVEAGQAAVLHALTPDCTERLLTLLLTLPHGVLKYSHAVEGGRGWVQNSSGKLNAATPHYDISLHWHTGWSPHTAGGRPH